MRSLTTILLFLSTALAADIQVTWRLEKDTKASSVTAVGSDRKVIAEACGSIIHAKYPIDFFDVDDTGSGNFTVGDASYLVYSLSGWSGGPACSRISNPQYTLIQCSNVTWDSTDIVVKDKKDSCFSDSTTDGELQSLQRRSLSHEMHSRGAELEKRQTFCSGWFTRTTLVGDGDPHQNYFHKQLSENINCANAASCSVGQTDSTSYTWLNCRYTVQEWTKNTCTEGQGGTPYVMYSPNENNKGGGYYCVIGTCRSKGEGYWDYNGRAGGP
ncbi:hypothetical protein H9Q69_011457 [Fusarium xylarioides]|uniref:Uncharacterized protein n=1 Tax=Fusarium xylarioides TaxID=221167 RepID=A0A9P7IH38_9HYPO|nr:hypothetical protein H9Q70_008260 [Fusarium xylarioides]KAG5759201.1 hypothetical protein H9Q72_012677 [Fusarium xylarioides]KAG5789493.1 hypothetical protein H9Q69_011457 [Fusarium xylarioides]KAG5808070.1 hypothetical protein H9Q71_007381 [Fusarium xylarioides]KAG5821865.1 hypothetical protein H9Q74_007995 [Fusarium xylarioides]